MEWQAAADQFTADALMVVIGRESVNDVQIMTQCVYLSTMYVSDSLNAGIMVQFIRNMVCPD